MLDQIDPAMKAVSNLYSSELFCSECFMKVWRQRLLSPLLPAGNFTDYLIEQFEDMQTVCSTTMPYVTSASTLYVGTPTATITATATRTGTTPTCTGQWVGPAPTPLGCNQLADMYQVSTGDIREATGHFYCEVTREVCLPPPCPLEAIRNYGTTWQVLLLFSSSPSLSTGKVMGCNGWRANGDDRPSEQLAAQLSNSTYNVTAARFFGWNQNIQGSCDDLALDQRVCYGYVLPPLVFGSLPTDKAKTSRGFLGSQ